MVCACAMAVAVVRACKHVLRFGCTVPLRSTQPHGPTPAMCPVAEAVPGARNQGTWCRWWWNVATLRSPWCGLPTTVDIQGAATVTCTATRVQSAHPLRGQPACFRGSPSAGPSNTCELGQRSHTSPHARLPRQLQRSTCTFVQLQRLMCGGVETTCSALSTFQAALNRVRPCSDLCPALRCGLSIKPAENCRNISWTSWELRLRCQVCGRFPTVPEF